MRSYFVVFCLLSLALVSSALFAQEPSEATQGVEGQSLTEDDVLLETYLEESRKLSEEFTPLHNRLCKEGFVVLDAGKKLKTHDYERWEKEYYQPLFRKAKEAMEIVLGVDDYLSMWENKIPQKLWAAGQREFDKGASVPYTSWALSKGELSLLTLYTLAVAYDQRSEILKDSVYEDSPEGADFREDVTAFTEYSIRNPWEFQGAYKDEICEMFKRIEVWYIFPPRMWEYATFDDSWHAMAIYSFKNERSRNILYEIASESEEDYGALADWACYYLALSPGSNELLPDVKNRLKERIAVFREEEPVLGGTLFNKDGKQSDSSMKTWRELASGRYSSDTKKAATARALCVIQRLFYLERTLEFNEKVPEKERERFEIVRRELAISWALSNKTSSILYRPFACLKKGEEHFKIYCAEYEIPWLEPRGFYSLGEKDSSSVTGQELKLFYERELANPRPIYTDLQKRYVQEELDELNRALKQEQKR